MNVNVWNIKEMLGTPAAPGPNKFSFRGSAHSDYSSLSDSQLLFGSQFCPENTQLAMAPLELGTQLGQQNSQDSEPSIFTKYQTKPQLFDDDAKERSLLNFGAGKAKSILENFDVNKNKIKDKYDREVLSTLISSIKDKLQGLQACLGKFEETFDSRNKSVLDHVETVSKTSLVQKIICLGADEEDTQRRQVQRPPSPTAATCTEPPTGLWGKANTVQDALQTHCGSVLKALTDKSQMEQTLLEMERRLAAKDEEILEVKSSVQQLKEGLESLPAQLSEQHLKLYEQLGFLKLPSTLDELHTSISTGRLPLRVAERASQTSPGVWHGRALAEEGGRAGSSSRQAGSLCVALPKGGSCTSHQPAGDCTCGGKAASGRKVSPAATAACGRANTSLQEMRSALGTQSCAGSPCSRCASSHLAGSGWRNHCPLPQEVPLPTPLRKAVKRDTRGFKALMKQPQGCHLSVHKDVSGQKDKNVSADHVVETVAAGRKAQQKSGRIPRNKAAGWKKTCPPRRRGEVCRCSEGGMKQRMANRILELEGSRKSCLPTYTVTLNSGSSDPVCAAPGEGVPCTVQQRLSKSSLQRPRSGEDVQRLVNRRKRSLENQGGASISNPRRNFCDSSPQENLFSPYSTAGGKRVSCPSPPSSASANKPHPAAALALQNVACCSLVFDSDYSD